MSVLANSEMDLAPLQVAVVGCGISGLTAAIGIRNAGHRVTIIERAARLAQVRYKISTQPILTLWVVLILRKQKVGAGIQLAPNITRILQRWGLLPQILAYSVEPQYLKLRSYRDGAVISATQIDPQLKMAYGVPYLVIHRADLAQVLLDKAKTLGVQTRFGSQITEIDPSRSSVKFFNGEQFKYDLILGADGLHSMCRELIPGQTQQPFFPGDLAFRIVLPKSVWLESKDLLELTKRPAVQIFMGPDAHVVLYPLKEGELYNIVLLLSDEKFPQEVLEDRYNPIADNQRLEWLRIRFSAWSGEVRAILNVASGASVWQLEHCQEATRWVHEAGKLALTGDACHATLPYL